VHRRERRDRVRGVDVIRAVEPITLTQADPEEDVGAVEVVQAGPVDDPLGGLAIIATRI